MTNIKESALAYEPQITLNISELGKIPIDLPIGTKTGTDKDDKEFTYKVIEVDGKEYRVPNSVLRDLKAIIGKIPDLVFFSVLKSGSGLKTSYQVIPFTK